MHCAIAVTSGYGRGQVTADAQLQFDTLVGLARNPNVAAVVVLAASGEITASYVDAIAASGKPAVGVSLPDVHEDALALVDAVCAPRLGWCATRRRCDASPVR